MSEGAFVVMQMAVPVADNGTEVLQVGPARGTLWTILSVPVFAFGLSRGTIVRATSGHKNRLIYSRVIQVSDGATIRCYTKEPHVASHTYLDDILPSSLRHGVGIGPATLFDPDIVAVHLHDRTQWSRFAALADELVRAGTLSFWELADPDIHPVVDEPPSRSEPWELEHPVPGGDVIQVK